MLAFLKYYSYSRACVPYYTKVPIKKRYKMKKKCIFFLWVKKVYYICSVIIKQ